MPFVNEIEESEADGHLRELYGKIEQKRDFCRITSRRWEPSPPLSKRNCR